MSSAKESLGAARCNAWPRQEMSRKRSRFCSATKPAISLEPCSPSTPAARLEAGASGGKSEMHDVTVGDDIVAAFEAEFAGLARAGFSPESDVIVVGDGLGADEALFEIGVDHARCLRRARALLDRPGTGLFRSGGEIGDEMQEIVAGADDAIQSRFR